MTKNAGKACNNRLYRHIRTFEKIIKNYFVISSEIKRVITEALLADSRITGVTDFKVEKIDKRTARVSFTAETIFGEIPVERTVTTNV